MNMAKLDYRKLSYTDMDCVSSVVINELERQKEVNKSDIKGLAWYKCGRYSTQPLIVFLKDGKIFKIKTRKGKIIVENVRSE